MIRGILDGVLSYFRALQIIQKRNLWGYFLLPGLISVLSMLILTGIVYVFFDDIGGWVSGLWPFEWGKEAIDVTGGVLFSLLVLVMYLIAFKYIIIIALGPFLSPLSEKVEKHVNGRSYPPNSFADNLQLMWRGASVAIYLFLMEMLLTLPLLVLSFIPGLAVITSPLLLVIQGYYAGRGNMDFVLERRFGVLPSIRSSRKHKWLAIGNGVVYVLLIASVIGVFFAPILSAAGLTVEMVKRLDAEQEHSAF